MLIQFKHVRPNLQHSLLLRHVFRKVSLVHFSIGKSVLFGLEMSKRSRTVDEYDVDAVVEAIQALG